MREFLHSAYNAGNVVYALKQLVQSLGDLVAQICQILRGGSAQQIAERIFQKPAVIADVLDGRVDFVRDARG